MATLNAVGRPRSLDTPTADHVTTTADPGDTATGSVDDNHKVGVAHGLQSLANVNFCYIKCSLLYAVVHVFAQNRLFANNYGKP